METERDAFTDEVKYHALTCGGTGIGIGSVGFNFLRLMCNGVYSVRLAALWERHLKDQIRLRYRWGKREVRDATWKWATGVAIKEGMHAVDRFLAGMAATDRLVYQVGRAKTLVEFSESERKAIPDFKSRCGK